MPDVCRLGAQLTDRPNTGRQDVKDKFADSMCLVDALNAHKNTVSLSLTFAYEFVKPMEWKKGKVHY